MTLAVFALTHLALAESSRAEFTLKEDAPATGTSLKREILRGSQVPLEKEWHELSRSQQQTTRLENESLPEDHEPPFPKGGLRSIYKPIADAYQRVSTNIDPGEVLMVATIDKQGIPTKLDVYKTVDDRNFTAFIAGQIMKARYKPALCTATPCEMQFVVALRLQRLWLTPRST